MESTKIKLFGPEKTKEELENVMNTFMSTIRSFYINEVNFQVTRNFLPQTTLSEYQECWYGSVCYDEEPDEEK